MSVSSREVELRLHAQLNVQYLRGLKLAWLSRLAAASLPLWLQCLRHPLPGLLEWFAVLSEGFCLVMAVGYSVLEYRWTGRAAEMEYREPGVVIHAPWSPWDEVRAALRYGLALVSLIPWVYVAGGRPLPPSLLSALIAAACTVFLLLVLAETASHLNLSDGDDPSVGGCDSALPRGHAGR